MHLFNVSSRSLSSLSQYGQILTFCLVIVIRLLCLVFTQKDSKSSRDKFSAVISKCSNTKFGEILAAHFRTASPPWILLQSSTTATLWSTFCHWQWLKNSRLDFKFVTKCSLAMLVTSRAAQKLPIFVL